MSDGLSSGGGDNVKDLHLGVGLCEIIINHLFEVTANNLDINWPATYGNKICLSLASSKIMLLESEKNNSSQNTDLRMTTTYI